MKRPLRPFCLPASASGACPLPDDGMGSFSVVFLSTTYPDRAWFLPAYGGLTHKVAALLHRSAAGWPSARRAARRESPSGPLADTEESGEPARKTQECDPPRRSEKAAEPRNGCPSVARPSRLSSSSPSPPYFSP